MEEREKWAEFVQGREVCVRNFFYVAPLTFECRVDIPTPLPTPHKDGGTPFERLVFSGYLPCSHNILIVQSSSKKIKD